MVSPVFLTAQQQPFVVVGTANEPFMAKVIFEWVGGGKMEVEHWVEVCKPHRRFHICTLSSHGIVTYRSCLA